MAPSYFDSSSSPSPSSSSSSSSEEDIYQGFQTTLQAVIENNFVNNLMNNVGNIVINHIGNNQPEENDPPPRYTAQNTGLRTQAPPIPRHPPANTGRRLSLLNATPAILANTLSENLERERTATRAAARLKISRPPTFPSQNTRAAKPLTSSRLNQRPWTLREYKFISETLPLPPPYTPGHPPPLIYTPETRPDILSSLRASRIQRAKDKFQEKFKGLPSESQFRALHWFFRGGSVGHMEGFFKWHEGYEKRRSGLSLEEESVGVLSRMTSGGRSLRPSW